MCFTCPGNFGKLICVCALRVVEASGECFVSVLRVLEALGGSSVCVLRVMEALGSLFVSVLYVSWRLWEVHL